MSYNQYKLIPQSPFLVRCMGDWLSSGSASSFQLNSANARIGWRYFATHGRTVTAFIVAQGTLNGTLANISLEGELLNAGPTNSRAGTTVLANKAGVAPAGANGNTWYIRFLFDTPYTLVPNNHYFFSVKNTSSVPATDYVGIRSTLSRVTSDRGFALQCYSSTSAWTTNGSALGLVCPIIIEFDDGTYEGQPCNVLEAVFPSNNRFRGGRLMNLRRDIRLAAVDMPTTLFDFRIYDYDQLPNDTPLLIASQPSSFAIQTLRLVLPEEFVLRKGKSYRIGWKPSSNASNPSVMRIKNATTNGVYTQCDSLLPKDFILRATYDNGANGWTDEDEWTVPITAFETLPILRGGVG